MKYKIFHNGGTRIHFIEEQEGVTIKSGQPFCEEFEIEGEAVARLLELRETYFPEWDREDSYEVGDRVKFGDYVYRALQENDFRTFQLPDLEFNPNAEVATPRNRQARWVEVYDQTDYEEESYGGPI